MLKNIKIIGFLSLFFLGQALLGQALEKSLSSIMQQADVATLANYLGETVTVNILDDEMQLSRQDAIAKIESFFAANNPTAFSSKHSGKSKEGNTFVIGEYKSENTIYRTYFVLQDEKIQEFCIEEEE